MYNMGPANRTKNIEARFALSMGRPKFQDGGGITEPVVTGPLLGYDGGRSDTRNVSVPPGSFVIPADVVSGLPGAEGNSLAGHAALTKLFASLPLLPDEAPFGAPSPNLPTGKTIPGLVPQHRLMTHALGESRGGKVGGADDKPIPVAVADGEFIAHPAYVRRLGLGNLKRGHAILDAFVDHVRKLNIKTLSKLPSTVKDGAK